MKRKMKLVMSVICVVVCMFATAINTFAAVGIDYVTAKSYVVMDADTGEVIYSRNPDTPMLPASTTKIMTMALALEKLGMNRTQLQHLIYTTTKAAAYVPYKSTAIYLQPGEKITAWDALMATELKSANDGANALAELASGSIQNFVQDMNEKAVNLGCKNTHFVNAHGCSEDGHYVSAYDLALITKWALSVPFFKEVFSTDSYTIPATDYFSERTLETQNLMAEGQKFYYPGTIGGKSGWTNDSGYTQVEVVERDGHTLIIVVMDTDGYNQKFYDSIVLADNSWYVFK